MTDAARNYSIIGIHGLQPKPPMDVLRRGWLSALREGLTKNHQLPLQAGDLAFELVYWADWLGREPYAAGKDPEPYIEADGDGPLPRYRDRWVDKVVTASLDALKHPIEWADSQKSLDWVSRHAGVDQATALFLQLHFIDLSTYYADEPKRMYLRGKLRDALLAQKGKRIMLIAHSMGSIVAYDVLRALGRDNPDFEVSHFVTLGSPLGMPNVLHKIRDENAAIRTPSVVRRWTNLADRRDHVAFDAHLADDFDPNGDDVTVEDKLVINGYRPPKGKPTHHTIYGYLRTPEFTELVRAFV
jgi:Lecithin:cholesterol acyltransferase